MIHTRPSGVKVTTRLLLVIALAAAASLALAQQSEIRRTYVLRHDIGTSGREVVLVRVAFAQGAGFPRHTHPGEEIAYVIDGTLEYRLDGSPPVTLKAGEAIFIRAGTPHSAENVGAHEATELATYLVAKGQQLVVLTK